MGEQGDGDKQFLNVEAMAWLARLLSVSGYPRDSVRTGHRVADSQFDIVIFEEGKEWPIAVFELVQDYDKRRWDHSFAAKMLRLKQSLASFNRERSQQIPAYLVSYSDPIGNDLAIYSIPEEWITSGDEQLAPKRLRELPKYEQLLNDSFVEREMWRENVAILPSLVNGFGHWVVANIQETLLNLSLVVIPRRGSSLTWLRMHVSTASGRLAMS